MLNALHTLQCESGECARGNREKQASCHTITMWVWQRCRIVTVWVLHCQSIQFLSFRRRRICHTLSCYFFLFVNTYNISKCLRRCCVFDGTFYEVATWDDELLVRHGYLASWKTLWSVCVDISGKNISSSSTPDTHIHRNSDGGIDREEEACMCMCESTRGSNMIIAARKNCAVFAAPRKPYKTGLRIAIKQKFHFGKIIFRE